MIKMILASASPRRKELLAHLGISFEVIVSDAEENLSESDPVLLTESLSRQKAEAVLRKLEDEKHIFCEGDFCVIGADTVVFAGEEILGKPKDRKDARRMIEKIRGRAHTVCTGVTLCGKKDGERFSVTFSEQTKVHVVKMSEKEIESYLDTEEPYDKAGAYGIQGMFSRFIEKIEGDYFNVVGLPVHRLYEHLKKSGICGDKFFPKEISRD